MARRNITITAQGDRYRIGKADDFVGIWRRRFWGWKLVSRYPLTDEAWRVARGQFAAWEPAAAQPDSSLLTRQDEQTDRRRLAMLGALSALFVGAVVGVILILGNGGSRPTTVSGNVTPAAASPNAQRVVTAGPTPTTSTTEPAVGSGYLAVGTGWVAFLQWNDQAGLLSGTSQLVTTTGTPPNESTSTQTTSFTGSVHGSQIAVSFNGKPQTFGTIANGSVTLDTPQSDGTLAPITFRAASANSYNKAVSTLTGEVDTANQQAARAQAFANQEQQISKDAATVRSDISSLTEDESSLTSAVQGAGTDIQAQGKDLATTQAAEQAVIAKSTPATSYPEQNCGDASGVAGDASGVAGDASGVEGDASGVASAINTVGQDTQALRTAWSAYQANQQQLPNYVPASMSTAKEVSDAVGAAEASIASATATTNQDIDQANANVTAAYGYAAAAYQSAGCGTPPSAPSPEPHIS